jgi:hypothetical protein
VLLQQCLQRLPSLNAQKHDEHSKLENEGKRSDHTRLEKTRLEILQE